MQPEALREGLFFFFLRSLVKPKKTIYNLERLNSAELESPKRAIIFFHGKQSRQIP